MLNQQIKETHSDTAEILLEVLHEMDTCVSEQESIILEEREAMKIFDAQALTALIERRARAQSILNEVESKCRRMMNPSMNQNKMEDLIDMYAGDSADELHSLRIDLFRRMQMLERDHVENHIRLRAAWNVTTSILQQIGAVEANPTYQNNTYARQAGK